MSVLGKNSKEKSERIDSKDESKISNENKPKKLEDWVDAQAKKPAPSRSKKTEKNLKKATVTLYLTDDEYVKLKEKARQSGLKISPYIVTKLIYNDA